MLRWLLRPFWERKAYKLRPLSSEVLEAYIRRRDFPQWTAFYIRYKHVQDDHFGRSHFNHSVDGKNYRVLRTGAFPFIKYHCTAAPLTNLCAEDRFYALLKVINLGFVFLSCFLLGIGIPGLVLAALLRETVAAAQRKQKLVAFRFSDWKNIRISGIPCLGYGVAGLLLARHFETVTFWSNTAGCPVTVELRFWYKETW